MTDSDASELSAETPIGKFRARGADLISIMLAGWLGLLTYGLYMHMMEARESAKEMREVNQKVANTLSDTNKEISKAMADNVKAQRFTACLVATKEDQRELQYIQPQSFCNRMTQ